MKSQVFIATLIGAILFMLNKDFFVIFLASLVFFSRWIFIGPNNLIIARLLTLLLCLVLLVIIISIPFMVQCIRYHESFHLQHYIFRNLNDFIEEFKNSKCYYHATIYMFLRSFVQATRFVYSKFFKLIKLPYIVGQYYQRHQLSFAWWQICTYLFYFMFAKLDSLILCDTLYSVRPVIFLSFVMIVQYISVHFTSNSMFLLLQLVTIVLFYLKKLNLQSEFGNRKPKLEKRAKPQKKRSIQEVFSAVTPISVSKFDDIHNFDGLKVIRQISEAQPVSMPVQTKPLLTKKLQKMLDIYISTVSVQLSSVMFIVTAAVGNMELSQELTFVPDLIQRHITLQGAWLALVFHVDTLFVPLISKKRVLAIGLLSQFLAFYRYKQVWMFYLCHSLGYGMLLFAASCLALTMYGAAQKE